MLVLLPRTPRPAALALVAVTCFTTACGDPPPSSEPTGSTEQATGGAPGTGGGAVGSGGLGRGGASSSTGGAVTGGFGTSGLTAVGGLATGGQPVGGRATGGLATGGFPTGGIAAGAAPAGGAQATGGALTGGVPTGGFAPGGAESGGVATGGMGTGGSTTGAAAAGGTDGECAGPVPGTSGHNPLIPEIYTADPAALVHDCTFYITAGHDEGTTGFQLRDWYVLSSTDMVNWSAGDGPVMSLDTFHWANANAWAGQMVEREERFYWYVPVNESAGAMAIGVAVGDSPLGPFSDAIGGPLVNDATEMAAFGYSDPGQTAYTIDPSVFVDDDGQAYLVYGGFWRMVVARLGNDMISIEGSMQETTPPDFFEAPYLTKRNGTYYVVYAAGSNPATIDYVMADSPTGPWRNHGQIMESLPNQPGQDAATSHPAIAEFAGQWYLVYHLSDGPGGGTYRRQVAIDKLSFNEDGTIRQVTPSDGLTF